MLLFLCLGRTRAEETFNSNVLWWLYFAFLAVAIQRKSFITNYKHIYIVIKPSKSCTKNNLQSGSGKLDFPNNSSLEDDLIEFAYLNFKFFNGGHKFC